jgi:hypothetical protein
MKTIRQFVLRIAVKRKNAVSFVFRAHSTKSSKMRVICISAFFVEFLSKAETGCKDFA